MPARGKRYLEALKKVDRTRTYEPREALRLLREVSYTKFDPTVEVHIRTGLDPRHAEQMVRGSVVLPAGTGKRVRVLAFAQGEKLREAEEAGADYVGGEDLVKRIQDGWLEFDVAVATPDMMGLVGRLGRILGPRGLMPNPRTGTVSMDIGRVIREVRAGRVEFRVDKTGVIHGPIGKLSFSDEQLLQNLGAFIDAVIRAKPPTVKGQYLRSITLSSTMSPGIKLDIPRTTALAAAA
ncbi:MAG TPA: 50S ribosomal protein L1 [Chloroflexota bacterium]|jgi:large subunit ribosomal protein L1|nr:50S ribosomal protein L1 [Chloroflexota bacterium]HZU07814.1 50S ribosomal protein L1 [Chloroflexota bacterium]